MTEQGAGCRGSAALGLRLLTWGLCFSHSAGMSLCTVWYSTGISYTCRSTLSPSPSFSSSWGERQGEDGELAEPSSLQTPGSSVVVAHQGHTAPERRRQEQELEASLSYTEKLKAASAT